MNNLSETEPLKPCPFCGGRAAIDSYDESELEHAHQQRYWAICMDCDAGLTPEQFDLRDAVDRWNRRADSGPRKPQSLNERWHVAGGDLRNRCKVTDEEIFRFYQCSVHNLRWSYAAHAALAFELGRLPDSICPLRALYDVAPTLRWAAGRLMKGERK